MARNNTAASTGVSIPTVLTLIFVVLKLCKVITWSWWWVLSPTLISLGIVFLLLAIVGIAYILK